MKLGERIISKYLQAKEETKTLGVSLEAYEVLDKDSVKVAASSSTPIDRDTLRAFVFSAFDYSLTPIRFTDAYYEGDNNMFYATCVASRTRVQRPAEGSKFTRISANSYLDEDLGKIWEKQEIEGKPYFVRDNDDDIQKIVESVAIGASSALGGFNPRYEVGSQVEFYHRVGDKAVVKSGKVTKFDGPFVNIKCDAGTVKIPSGAIIKVNDAPKEGVIEYIRKAYNVGDVDYASFLTK